MLCEDDAMTFTASGEIFTHLLLDRGKTFELFDENLPDLGNLLHNVSVNRMCLIGEQPFWLKILFNKMSMTFCVDCHQRLNVLSLTDDDPPISPLQLPAYCGYSVKMSWSDVKLMVPYNACYITQEVCW